MTDKKTQNIINHVALVLDASGSMGHLRDKVVQLVDAEVRRLAEQSKALDQETRITLYAFADNTPWNLRTRDGRASLTETVPCLVYDKDVLRLPSIASLYKAGGDTPLYDAIGKAIEDLRQTPETYGDHAFLLYVFTDGEENRSRHHSAISLASLTAALPENWTLAGFVPSEGGRRVLAGCGFSLDNTMVWSATERGTVETMARVATATSSYMSARSTGLRGTKNLFALDTSALTPGTVAANTQAQHFGQYRLLHAPGDMQISTLVEQALQRPYKIGEAFYQLTKPEKIQPQKEIVLLEKKGGRLFKGPGVRKMLGLPSSYEVKVAPAEHPLYNIYPQSTSTNRKVLAGTNVLVMS